MSTQMFSGVKTPSSFFAPIISPVDVAKHILKLIEKGESGSVTAPFYAQWIQVFGLLPVGIQTLVRRWSGVDKAVERAGLVHKVDVKSG